MSFLYSPSPSFQTVYSVETWGNTTTRKEAKRRRSTKLFFDWLRRESHHLLHLLVVFFLCLFFVDVDVDVVPLYSIQLFPCFCSSSSKFRCVATTRESISFQSKKKNFFSFSLLLPPLSTDWKKNIRRRRRSTHNCCCSAPDRSISVLRQSCCKSSRFLSSMIEAVLEIRSIVFVIVVIVIISFQNPLGSVREWTNERTNVKRAKRGESSFIFCPIFQSQSSLISFERQSKIVGR